MNSGKEGFSTNDHQAIILWQKYQYWKNGIPAHQFRKERLSDVKEIMEIESAMQRKQINIQAVEQAMAELKSKVGY